jgi:hypothetical protein
MEAVTAGTGCYASNHAYLLYHGLFNITLSVETIWHQMLGLYVNDELERK